jgi:hypothetical protein
MWIIYTRKGDEGGASYKDTIKPNWPGKYDKWPLLLDLQLTHPQTWVIAIFVFGFGPLVAKPRIRLDRNLVCELHLTSDTYAQSFGSIAPAVTKRALLTDDDDDATWLYRPAGEPKIPNNQAGGERGKDFCYRKQESNAIL